ncbi:YeeE/YedE thiosulfate transporter family protein [Temperatibacter marinus]|uniref:YeeE/YedE thiosulfate transporter family protein n=1 Tax=Temperatibacter marinus TaxID=1456591 RepID=A0AA52H8R3_9PROT|nr:DUF6691 family protein [Temperatibacter marinus]WND02109.1 YeeE/YedE thiosulfate transporter family protein [Temperatibacter marinus]
MSKLGTAILSGLIFGFGLLLSGMANPQKVINFLDITGQWDPSLAFVMIGAILTTVPGYFLLKKFHMIEKMHLSPAQLPINKSLIIGACLFGIGWALVGLCPGPAFTLVYTAPEEALYFLLPMAIGLIAGRKLKRHL